MMRVVAGKYGGRKLKGPRGLALRPSSDRLRETLFNILGPTIENAVFVDVYAGTGAVGIEALSRGARQAIFIENHPVGIELLSKNLDSLGIPRVLVRAGQVRRGIREAGEAPPAELLAMEALRGLALLADLGLRAEFFFLDPPYDARDEYESALGFLDASSLLLPVGRVILEHASRSAPRVRLKNLECSRVVEQGDASLSFYQLVRAA